MSARIAKYNRFDLFIFLLVTSLVAGNMFGALQLPRVIALVLLIPFLELLPKAKSIGNMSTMILWAVLFIFFCILSCIWNPAGIKNGVVTTIYNIVHFILFFELILFSRFARNPIKAIVYGCLVAVAISAVIAFWELTTDQHLSTSKSDEARSSMMGANLLVRYFSAVTFYNFNMYVTFLCLLLPFLFWGISNRQNSSKTRLLFVAMTIVAVVLILYNGSRGGLIASILMIVIYFVCTLKINKKSLMYAALFLFLMFLILHRYGDTILNTLTIRGEAQGSIMEEGRFGIWSNVMKVVNDYLWVGCGAGGLSTAMSEYSRGGITISHNVFLEVLSQYGIVFFGCFIAYLVSIFKKARTIEDTSRRICLYQYLIAFPIVGIINSGYLEQPSFWTTMALIYIFANYEQIRPSGCDIRQTA